MTEIDASLQRVGTDYVDLYQIHRFDPITPIDETLEALNDLVRAGKVRYVGASSMHAWQFAKMLYTSRLNGWTRFVSMQNHLNLLNREEEREMRPLCADQGVGVIPWSPLARGRPERSPWAPAQRQTAQLLRPSLRRLQSITRSDVSRLHPWSTLTSRDLLGRGKVIRVIVATALTACPHDAQERRVCADHRSAKYAVGVPRTEVEEVRRGDYADSGERIDYRHA